MNAELFPSGDATPDAAPPPLPPRPPRPPRPPDAPAPAGMGLSSTAHWLPARSHFHALPSARNDTDFPSADGSISVNGRCAPSYFPPAAVEREAASLA